VFTTAYDPFIGGAEIAIHENAKRLGGEFDFVVLTSRFAPELPKKETKENITIMRLGLGKAWDKFLLPFTAFFAVLFLWRRFKGRKKIFWVVMASYGSIAASTLKFFFPRVPYILTLQEGDTEEHLRKSRLGLVHILGFRYALKQCDYVTAISAYLLDLAYRLNYKGPGEVVPNGVDLKNFARSTSAERSEEILRRLGLRGFEKIIITASRLVLKNGIDTIVAALALIKKANPELNLKFLVLGSGQEAQAIKSLAKALGVLDDVIFAGSVSHEHLPDYLKIANVFVRPSRSEGLGNSFIEAMAAGVPIIGTPVGGIPDFLKDGVTGLFTSVDDPEDLAQKILKVFTDESLKTLLVNEAKKLATARYDWEAISKSLLKIFSAELEKSAKPRVLVVTGIFPPDIGGPATYSRLVAGELERRRFFVRLISYRDAEVLWGDAKDGGIRKIRYRTYFISRKIPKGIRHFLYFLKCVTAGLHCDIFFAQDPVSAGFPALCAARILRKKYIVKVTGDYAWEQGVTRFGVEDAIDVFQIRHYRFLVELLRFVEAHVCGNADRVLVPSQYLKRIVSGWRIPDENISVIFNAVEPVDIPESKEEIRRELGIPEEEKIILSIGRLVLWKGFETLIYLASDLTKTYNWAHVIIVGDGPDYFRLQRAIIEREAENAVTIIGKRSKADIMKYLKASDVFILNTSYEGFSHQIIEAQSAGIPVITTDVGGNPEIITDMENGILVPFNDSRAIRDAVRLIFSDAGVYKKLREHGKERAREFSKERMMKGLIGLFENYSAKKHGSKNP